MINKLIISLLLLFSAPAFAENHYVTQEDAGTNAGTEANPWQGWDSIDWDTDGDGVDTGVGAGDTLYIVGTLRGKGIYSFTGYGLAEDNRMTIKSDPTTPGKMWQGIEIDDADWSEEDAFGAYSKVGGLASYPLALEWVTATNDPWTHTILTIEDTLPDGTWAAGSFYNPGAGTVYYKPSDGTLAGKTLTTWQSTSRVFQIGNKDYITLSGLVFNNPVLIYNSTDYFIIENCEISCLSDKVGMAIGDQNNTTGSNYGIIRGNYIHHASNGIYFRSEHYDDTTTPNNWLVEYNYITNISGSSDSHGIGVQGGSDNIIQYNNLSNAASGITFWNNSTSAGGYDQTLQNNIARFNYVHHMGFDGDTDTPDGSIGRGIEFEGETDNSDLTTGNMIYGNIIEDCVGAGIRISNGIPTTGYSIKVFNNTIDDCGYSIYMIPTGYENDEIGAYFHNNISSNVKSGGEHIHVNNTTGVIDISSDHNIFYPDTKFRYQGADYANLAAWKAINDAGNLVSPDPNSVASDPGLTDYIPDAASGVVYDGEVLTLGYNDILNPTTTWPTSTPGDGDVDIIQQGTSFDDWFIGAFSAERDVSISASGRFNFGN